VLTVVAPPLATLAVRSVRRIHRFARARLIFLAYMSSSSLIRTLLMAASAAASA